MLPNVKDAKSAHVNSAKNAKVPKTDPFVVGDVLRSGAYDPQDMMQRKRMR